jgi:hypothetical protein
MAWAEVFREPFEDELEYGEIAFGRARHGKRDGAPIANGM